MSLIVFYYAVVAIITAYLLLTITKFREVPPSISETYYLWKSVGKDWIFTTMMWIIGFSILVYWVSVAKNYNCQFLTFLSVSGMCFVGGACMFKQTLTKEVHYTSAALWAISATLFFIVNKMFEPIIVGGMFGFTGWMLNKRNNFTFWAELACVIMMIIGIWLL